MTRFKENSINCNETTESSTHSNEPVLEPEHMASLGLNTQPADGSLCKHCFNLDFDKIQAEYMRTRHSGVGLQKYKESSEACATCSILFRTTQHFYPEVAEAASLYEVFLSLVQGESNQSPHDVPVLSLTPAGSNDRKNNPVEKVVVDAWKNRIIHFSSAPGMMNAHLWSCCSLLTRSRKAVSVACNPAWNDSQLQCR